MTDPNESVRGLLASLNERAKELNCLYAIEELLNTPEADLEDVGQKIVEAIPPGWQYPHMCEARLILEGTAYVTSGFIETPWHQSADVKVFEESLGVLEVYYTEEAPAEDDGPFLKEETRLIRTIADRLAHFVHHHRMRMHFDRMETARQEFGERPAGDWRVVLNLLSRTDRSLYTRICHKMLNQLCWSGIKEAEDLLERAELYRKTEEADLRGQTNVASESRSYDFSPELAEETFRLARANLADETILYRIQKWMQEDKLGFLVRSVERNLSLAELADSIRRYHHLAASENELPRPVRSAVRVALIRRFLSDQLEFIRVAKEYVRISDFHELLQHMIYTNDSYGRLGGKSAGLYLAARILEKERANRPEIGDFKVPKTWHITSDMQLEFMHHNNLDEVVEQKYKDLSQIRFEYPHIVHTCKSAHFPMEFRKGLSLALDDFRDSPLIVRSSSVLEDRVGAAFSGKYKSLFVPNQGPREERLEGLLDAIAEVYASMFGPDPMEYRSERGLLDFAEEMGIMIQEVVGTRVGPYHLPLFAGVALSHNEFRWSPRIKREDGIVRLVPGLGTRAVDRLSDDYPVMFSPGQPGLRVNVSPDEILRYSPRWVDVINLETNRFETLAFGDLVRKYGDEIPRLHLVMSIHRDGHFSRPGLLDATSVDGDPVATFEGLLGSRKAVEQMWAILDTLHTKFRRPVDVEFAHDGKDLYILQCRTQTYSDVSAPAPIPKDVARDRLLFTANRYISNGSVSDITHIVYVDPERYSALAEHSTLLEVARAVGHLNKRLPKRQFVLMGPGRWGSRGDIKLGVGVTYSDINNTAVLIEVARTRDGYTPDLSFGTHFFQDLVEARIRYLPLYPDSDGVVFNERFLRGARNVLGEVLPAFAHLSDTIRVIDVPKETDGLVLRVLMNADLGEAVGIISEVGGAESHAIEPPAATGRYRTDHWRWRLQVAEQIAANIDPAKYGVKAAYLIGSTKNLTAGPASDIDLLLHVDGDPARRDLLLSWLEGWSLSLDEVNYLKTGYRSGGLLDIHLITDADIEKKSSYAVKIGAVTDAARPLELGTKKDVLE